MENITRDQLLEKTGSIYKLCNMAALRAMELNSGVKKLIESDINEKVTTTAIKEIAQDKVKLKLLKFEEE